MPPSKSRIHGSTEPAHQEKAFKDLCVWIDAHLDEPIGWQELMRESGLDFQVIHQRFLKHTSMSPMTWIRRQREVRSIPPEARPLPAMLAGTPD